MKHYSIVRHEDREDNLLVAYNNSHTVHKFKQQTVEVNLYHYKKNTGFSIESTMHSEAIKTYFILRGSCRHLEAECVLYAGDLLAVGELDEFVNLYMLEDTDILVHAVHLDAFQQKNRHSTQVSQVLSKIQEKDSYTETHCSRVFTLVYQMALRLGYKGNRLFNILRAARYHDVGKIYIEDAILTKPGALTDEEYHQMKRHVVLGEELIAGVFNAEIFKIMSQHHERMDGSGYPEGLKGFEISEEGRILAICDSFDAMVTDRVYKQGKEISESLAELKSQSGRLYDGELVAIFADLIEAMNMDKEAYNKQQL